MTSLPDYLEIGPIRPTLNKRGYTIEYLDAYTRAFVDAAAVDSPWRFKRAIAINKPG